MFEDNRQRVVAGRFELVSSLGEGTSGAVYQARHTAIGREVAVKLLHPGLGTDPVARRRFLQEAQVAAQLQHPNVVAVYDVGEDTDGTLYIAMERLHGWSWREHLERGPLPVHTVLQLLLPAMEAVAHAHALGVVHRDLNPDNLFVCCHDADSTPTTKVLDFGLSKLVDSSGTTATTQAWRVGTPHYLAPEQLLGLGDIDGRADLYAFGVILYQALTGRLPHEGSTFYEVAEHALHHEPPSLHALRPDLDSDLCDIVTTCLRRDRDRRFPLMEALTSCLEAWMQANDATAQEAGEGRRSLLGSSSMPGTRLPSRSGLRFTSSESDTGRETPAAPTGRPERPTTGLGSRLWLLSALLVALVGAAAWAAWSPKPAHQASPTAPMERPSPAAASLPTAGSPPPAQPAAEAPRARHALSAERLETGSAASAAPPPVGKAPPPSPAPTRQALREDVERRPVRSQPRRTPAARGPATQRGAAPHDQNEQAAREAPDPYVPPDIRAVGGGEEIIRDWDHGSTATP